MKKVALGVIFSLFIAAAPSVNAMTVTGKSTVKNIPGDEKKKKKSCDSSKENCKGAKKSCCSDKSKEGMKTTEPTK